MPVCVRVGGEPHSYAGQIVTSWKHDLLCWWLGKTPRKQAPSSIPHALTLLTSMPEPNSLRAISLATIRFISLVRLHSTARHSTAGAMDA